MAAAGSGKTRAVTDRIAQIGRGPDVARMLPRLVVVTFANRAADEMQQRAREQILLGKPRRTFLQDGLKQPGMSREWTAELGQI